MKAIRLPELIDKFPIKDTQNIISREEHLFLLQLDVVMYKLLHS
jgi:hypothetical protein